MAMNSRRRASPPTILAVLAVTSASAGCMPAMAFTAVDIVCSPTSHARRRVAALPAHDDSGLAALATVTDANLHTLLRSPPGRPVLVDAYSPRCGPCMVMDRILRRAGPRYRLKVDFCKWNVEDREHTAAIRQLVAEGGFSLRGLPTLIVFREGSPVAIRKGVANEFQLDYFLEGALPDVLERTFDADGIKMVPLPEGAAAVQEVGTVAVDEELAITHCDYVQEEMVVSPGCGDGDEEEEEGRAGCGNSTMVQVMEETSFLPARDTETR